MRDIVFFISVVVFLALVPGTGLAIENIASGNPAGLSAFRPSIGSALIRSPNPIDTSGNLVITGNVRGGRHFRDVVPYRSSTDFGAVTGSSSLDSFLRRSAGSEDFGRFTGTYRPFFSPSGTVTALRPGQVRVTRPPTMLIGGAVPGSEVTAAWQHLPNQRFLPYGGLAVSEGELRGLRFAGFQTERGVLWVPTISPNTRVNRPLSMTLQEIERAILAEVGMPVYQDMSRMPGRRETVTGQDSRAQQFPPGLGGPEKQHAELKQSLVDDGYESSQLQPGKVLEKDRLRSFELQRSSALEDKQRDAKPDTGQEAQLDIYEHMEQKIQELQRSYERLMAEEAAKRNTGGTEDISASSPSIMSSKTAFESAEAADGRKGTSGGSSSLVDSMSAKSGSVEPGRSDVEAIVGDLGKWGQLPWLRPVEGEMRASGHADLSARAKAILGSYESFSSFWDAKFRQHVVAGEQYLKEGKFYRSADAYTLALVYKPAEPLGYLGKSHALFAAGEYMSSALFLSRAMTAAGEAGEQKGYEIQHLLALGSKLLASIDKDKLENRLADINQWQERSGSAELQFLLGYLYYQMDRLDAAGEAVDAAFKKMPEAPAVVALRKVIDSKRRPQGSMNP